jgi:hypothetical protein
MGTGVDRLSGVVCSACGRRPASRRLKVSESFTAYPDLFSGMAVCDVCAQLIEDARYRRSHWILVDGGVEVLDKARLLEVLRNPPEGSLVYVRSGGRRHGFIRALRYASTRSVAALCGEDEGAILIPRERLRYLVELAEKAYKTLRRKGALLNGCSVKEWVHEDICREVEAVRGDPAWRVVSRAL